MQQPRQAADRERGDRRGAALLWASWGLGPFAWAAHQNVSFAGLQWLCRDGAAALHLVSLAALAIAALGIWLGWRGLRAARRDRGAAPSRAYRRRRFMAAAGIVLSGFSFAGIALESLPNVILRACTGAG